MRADERRTRILVVSLRLLKPVTCSPTLQRLLVHRSRERELPGAHACDLFSYPRTLVLVAEAVCPPAVHATDECGCHERAVLALLRKHVQEETRGERVETELAEVLQDARDAEVVVRGTWGACPVSVRVLARGGRGVRARDKFR
jgi:hypothetical protein